MEAKGFLSQSSALLSVLGSIQLKSTNQLPVSLEMEIFADKVVIGD